MAARSTALSALAGRATSALRWGILWVVFGLSFLGRAVPKDDRLWVFGADGGSRFADNSKYLFLYAATERAGIRPVWLTANPETRDRLRRAGYESHLAGSPRGLYYTVRARYAFVSLGRGDIAWWLSGATTVVNLWHGCPLKRIGADRRGEAPGVVDRLIFRVRDSTFDRLVTTAATLRGIFAGAFELPREQVPALGYPRNDVLRGDVADATLGVDQETIDMIERRADDGPMIVYMPTYRQGFGMAHGGTDGPPLDLDRLDSLLERHDGTFLLKLHPHEQAPIDVGASDRIRELPADFDVYPILSEIDALVTDYSSVYLDYLHVDKPVVFYAYDLPAYESRPGFYFDYDEVTPGPTPETFPEFLAAMDEVLSGTDEYRDERAEIRRLFFDEPETRAAERVYDHFVAAR